MLLVAVAAAAVPISSIDFPEQLEYVQSTGERGKGRGGADCSRAGPFLKARTGVDVCVCVFVRACFARFASALGLWK